MVCSLHSHSGQFCLHADGNLEDVVKAAIKLGFKTYGFSEHMPRYRLKDLYPEEEKLSVESLTETFDAYVKEARRLQEKYRNKISLLVGAETENIYPESIQHVKNIRQQYNLDFLVGSVHHINEIPIDFSAEMFQTAVDSAGGLDQAFERYYDLQYELLTEIKPEVVGHLDLINKYCVAHPLTPAVVEKIRRNIQVGVSYGALFELNSSGFRKNLPGPHPQQNIVQMIQSLGGRFTLSDDSHTPFSVGQCYALVQKFIKENGITEVYNLEQTANGWTPVKIESIETHPFWTKMPSE